MAAIENSSRNNAGVESSDAQVSGEIVEIHGESYYRIANYDRMPPFLMSVVGSADQWMFVSSTGGLTCGRGNPDAALFPYDTDDKIHDSAAHTGPRTRLRVRGAGKTQLWLPFAGEEMSYDVRRNLYKSLVGNRLIFEESNRDLQLTCSSGWSLSDRFGFVKKTTMRNTGTADVSLEILDGFRNLLPPGITQDMQSRMSTLLDAYKKAETDGVTGAGIYSLTAIPTDGAEPCESLQASVAWSLGLAAPTVLLSERQAERFCAGRPVTAEAELNGQRGGYFVLTELILPPGGEADWYLLSDIGLGPSELVLLLDRIARGIDRDEIEADIESGTGCLRRLVADADGVQQSADEMASGRHFNNTLFNVMRGGVFSDGYRIRQDDLLDFIARWNSPLKDEFAALLAPKTDPLTRSDLLAAVEANGNAHMQRLALEYLPLTFSRRHGDPSRPWNRFEINVRNADGSERLDYAGNWRDLFQNWEALSISFPEFIESFIAKFVNASTVDGYNPYRISRDGIDWEVPEPGDAWSNIGYWGDHQVNYLSRLLGLSRRYHPGLLALWLDQDLFVYADVPYRIRRFEDILDNPRDSVSFDSVRARSVADRVSEMGADGKLVTLRDGTLYRVNLAEKLLLTVLTKLGNFVPGGGIWMNTQRPEWNDANNALVGYGLSVVTLAHLRRLLQDLVCIIGDAAVDSFAVSEEIVQFYGGVRKLLGDALHIMPETILDAGRKRFVDEMGAVASAYRERVYEGFSGRKSSVDKGELLDFIATATAHLDHTLGLSRRSDGLFHSYNHIHFGEAGYRVSHLCEMLEGQAAVLGAGFLEPEQSLALLDSLHKSDLYRSDQNSYLLYPLKNLSGFLEKNSLSQAQIEEHPCILRELKSGRTAIVEQDLHGVVHFNVALRNLADLRAALARIGDVSEEQAAEWCEVFESVFKHRESTGRSGLMYKYEGVGCIYWHMVSKLLLAVAEVLLEARDAAADQGILERLAGHFEDIEGGLGLYKSPLEYGAVPLDPYSHTPGFTGAQQPGMTGQVKEDIVTRFHELGVSVNRGSVSFRPLLLRPDEFASESEQLKFSFCGAPIIYRRSHANAISVFTGDEQPQYISGCDLGERWSRSLFRREMRIKKILVDFADESLGRSGRRFCSN